MWSSAGDALVGIESTLSYEIPKSTHARWHTKEGEGGGRVMRKQWEKPICNALCILLQVAALLHYCQFIYKGRLVVCLVCLFALRSLKLQHLVILLVMLDSPRSVGVHRGSSTYKVCTFHLLFQNMNFQDHIGQERGKGKN
jgi:hypothetical protein